MVIHIRLRHSLGERTLELPQRTVDNPLVIGRGADADVQVPSVNVAPRHTVLFVHDGHWVIQPTGDNAVTYVNSDLLTVGATYLQIGDVITLGTDANAPVLEVEPEAAAAGHTGYVQVADENAAPAVAERAGYAATAPVGYVGAPMPAGYGGYGYADHGAGGNGESVYEAHPAPAPAAVAPSMPAYGHDHHAQDHHDDPDHVSLGAAPVTPPGGRYYVPRKQGVSGGAIAFGAAAGIALLIFIGFLVYNAGKRPKPTVAVAPPPAEEPKRKYLNDPNAKGGNIFEFGREGLPGLDNTGQARTATPPKVGTNVRLPKPPPDPTDIPERPIETPAETPVKTPTEAPPTSSHTDVKPPVASTDTPKTPGTNSDAAQAKPPPTDSPLGQIEGAFYERDRAVALLKFEDFRRTNPGVGTERLNELTDALLDRVWWERIEQLVEKRNRVTQDLKDTEEAIRVETDPGFKKTDLIPKQEAQKRTLALTEQRLKEMGWDKQEPPPVADEDAMAVARGARNEKAFGEWKSRIMNSIRRQRQFPWAGE